MGSSDHFGNSNYGVEFHAVSYYLCCVWKLIGWTSSMSDSLFYSSESKNIFLLVLKRWWLLALNNDMQLQSKWFTASLCFLLVSHMVCSDIFFFNSP